MAGIGRHRQACRAFGDVQLKNSGEGGEEANPGQAGASWGKLGQVGSWDRQNAMEKLHDPSESKGDWFGRDMTLMARIHFDRRSGPATNQRPSIPPSATTASDLEVLTSHPWSITGWKGSVWIHFQYLY